MSYKPGDFFVGAIDFFGILVPGAILIFMHRQIFFGLLGGQLTTWGLTPWVVFFLVSYIIGHFLLAMGVPLNGLLRYWLPEGKDDYYKEVRELISVPRRHKIRPDVFHRVCAFIRLENGSAMADIERQIADYKLFRSLTLVFALDLLLMRLENNADRWPFSMALLILALVRYLFLLRWTYRAAFEYYVLIESEKPKAPKEQVQGPTQSVERTTGVAAHL